LWDEKSVNAACEYVQNHESGHDSEHVA